MRSAPTFASRFRCAVCSLVESLIGRCQRVRCQWLAGCFCSVRCRRWRRRTYSAPHCSLCSSDERATAGLGGRRWQYMWIMFCHAAERLCSGDAIGDRLWLARGIEQRDAATPEPSRCSYVTAVATWSSMAFCALRIVVARSATLLCDTVL